MLGSKVACEKILIVFEILLAFVLGVYYSNSELYSIHLYQCLRIASLLELHLEIHYQGILIMLAHLHFKF